ncbi:MAG TPA: sigma-70 family RNA polymerase sigma factor, partial [Candidatus Koribacter sp.]
MNEKNFLAEQFEANRSHLRAVAFRMLGSPAEADDAVQESWLRLSRSGAEGIENLGGWLTTVVARVCLDMLRSRQSRREDSLTGQVYEPSAPKSTHSNPEHEAMLADSLSIALLVVLDRLTPPERLSFVLHDLFGMSFEEIAKIIDRTPEATRQLASRARHRVQGVEPEERKKLAGQRRVVDAFLTALREGDFNGVMAVLHPDVVVHFDPGAAAPGAPTEMRGAASWARGAIAFSKAAG